MSAKPREVSVVIPTLGGPSLEATIEALNRSSLVPAEILVCIPAAEAPVVEPLHHGNVKVIVTERRGQVPQRATGFRQAAHDFVMQIDDDIIVEPRCIEQLAGALEALGGGAAVGPSLMARTTGESIYRKPRGNRLLLDLYYWLMNGAAGYRPGTIDKSGTLIGIDPGTAASELSDVECLAGGCAMHWRKNLVLEDFYPFPGKAYYEDVIHCCHLRRKGISLKVHSGARCWLEPGYDWHLAHDEYLKYLRTDCERRRYAMRLHSRESARIYLFYLVSYLRYLAKRVTGRKTLQKAADSR